MSGARVGPNPSRARSSCAWCRKPIAPAGQRSRLFDYAEGLSGRRHVAHFHVECSREMLDLCDTGQLEDGCADLAKPAPAVAEAPKPARPVRFRVPKSAAVAGERDLAAEARDLSARGFSPMAISARLRAPYAAVTAALGAASAFKHSRGDGA